jgi:hypothetical protein
MNKPSSVADMQKGVFYFGQAADSPWTDASVIKRFHLTLAKYPFR